MARSVERGFLLVIALGCIRPVLAGSPERVVVITLDGLRSDAVTPAILPFIASRIQRSAHTFEALCLPPTYTIPSHVSILTGLTPATHGVTEINDPGNLLVDGTILEVAHQAGLSTALYISKDKLRLLAKPGTCDRYVVTRTGYCDGLVTTLLEDLSAPETRLRLTVVHLQDLDTVGHALGWMSPQYLEAATRLDGHVRRIFERLEEIGTLSETLMLLMADHGGSGKLHSADLPEVKLVPWIALGPGVPAGIPLVQPVRLVDTAPTVLEALGLGIPERMEGVSVGEIFGRPWPLIRRGDVDGDARANITDAVGTLRYLFQGADLECPLAGDMDRSRSVELSDPVYLLNHLFLGGPAPPPPYPDCGPAAELAPDLPCRAPCR